MLNEFFFFLRERVKNISSQTNRKITRRRRVNKKKRKITRRRRVNKIKKTQRLNNVDETVTKRGAFVPSRSHTFRNIFLHQMLPRGNLTFLGTLVLLASCLRGGYGLARRQGG